MLRKIKDSLCVLALGLSTLAFVIMAARSCQCQQMNTNDAILVPWDSYLSYPTVITGPLGVIPIAIIDGSWTSFLVRGQAGQPWAIFAVAGPPAPGWGGLGNFLFDVNLSNGFVILDSGYLPALAPPCSPCLTTMYSINFYRNAGDVLDVTIQAIVACAPGTCTYALSAAWYFQ